MLALAGIKVLDFSTLLPGPQHIFTLWQQKRLSSPVTRAMRLEDAAAALRRMGPNGGRRAGTWELATSHELMRCPSRFNGARVPSFINARAAGRSFRECAELNERSPVWNAVANSTAESLIAARSFDLCKERVDRRARSLLIRPS